MADNAGKTDKAAKTANAAKTAKTAKTDKAAEREVRMIFDLYKRAVVAKDGGMAANLVDRGTFAYYERMRIAALGMKARQLKKRDGHDQLAVLMLRAGFPRRLLRKLRGKQLYIYVLDTNLMSSVSVGNSKLGAVRIDGSRATATLHTTAPGVTVSLEFVKEQGRWKVRTASFRRFFIEGVRRLAREAKRSESDTVFMLLRQVMGSRVKRRLWHPPR